MHLHITCLEHYFFFDRTFCICGECYTISHILTKLTFISLFVFMCDGCNLRFLRFRRWRPLQEDLTGPYLMLENIISTCVHAQDDEIVV